MTQIAQWSIVESHNSNMLRKIGDYLPLYLGCETNTGKLIGVCHHIVYTQMENGDIAEYNITGTEFPVKLFLRKLSDITAAERTELIAMGISIGRPSGYSFSPDAFLFLLSLRVDVFGLIDSGLAFDMSERQPL